MPATRLTNVDREVDQRGEKTMMKLHEKTDRTYDRYHELARNLIAQYSRECPADDASIEYPERCLACADWFLGQTGRWSPAYTRQLSAALCNWSGRSAPANLSILAQQTWSSTDCKMPVRSQVARVLGRASLPS